MCPTPATLSAGPMTPRAGLTATPLSGCAACCSPHRRIWADHGCCANPHRAPFSLQGGVGARVPVTLDECAVACRGAPNCDAFTYNAAQQGCFLKTAQCPLRNNCQVGGRVRVRL